MTQNLTHPGANGPASSYAAVTPDDGADLPGGVARAVYVGTAGALRVISPEGDDVTIQSAGGQYHPLRVARVMAAGTDAAGIVALY